jgi:hypothetical protein
MDNLKIIHCDRNRLVLRQGGLWWTAPVGGFLITLFLGMLWMASSSTRLTCMRAPDTLMQCHKTHYFLNIPHDTEDIGPLRGARMTRSYVHSRRGGSRTVTGIILITAADTQSLGPHEAPDYYPDGQIVNAINTFVQTPHSTHLDVMLDEVTNIGAEIAFITLMLSSVIAIALAQEYYYLTRWTFDRERKQVIHRHGNGRQVKTDIYQLRDIANVQVAELDIPQSAPTYRVELITYDRNTIPLLLGYSNRAGEKKRVAEAIREFLQV